MTYNRDKGYGNGQPRSLLESQGRCAAEDALQTVDDAKREA